MSPVDAKAAAVRLCMAVADAIRDLGRVPSGHLYARLQGHMDLDTYERIIGALIGAGLVERSGAHELKWVGPAKPPPKPGA